jgi:hypothetical protein
MKKVFFAAMYEAFLDGTTIVILSIATIKSSCVEVLFCACLSICFYNVGEDCEYGCNNERVIRFSVILSSYLLCCILLCF